MEYVRHAEQEDKRGRLVEANLTVEMPDGRRHAYTRRPSDGLGWVRNCGLVPPEGTQRKLQDVWMRRHMLACVPHDNAKHSAFPLRPSLRD